MATVAWTATGDTSFSFTARRWSPWLPTSARTFLPVLSVISVSPAKAALSRPWIEGRLSKNDCAYASAARPITSRTASTAPSPRSIAVRRIFCPIGDHAAWIRARGLCPPFVLIRSGTFRAMFGGAQDSTLSHPHQRPPNGEGSAAMPVPAMSSAIDGNLPSRIEALRSARLVRSANRPRRRSSVRSTSRSPRKEARFASKGRICSRTAATRFSRSAASSSVRSSGTAETLDLVSGSAVAESSKKRQVVSDLQPAARVKGQSERRRSDGDAGERGPESLGDAAHRSGQRHRRRTVGGWHDRDDVGLARGDVHLRQKESREQEHNRPGEGGTERDEEQQDVAWQVCEDHRVDEPDAARQPARNLVGDGLEESDRREYRS